MSLQAHEKTVASVPPGAPPADATK
jgi:hypothetical protein